MYVCVFAVWLFLRMHVTLKQTDCISKHIFYIQHFSSDSFSIFHILLNGITKLNISEFYLKYTLWHINAIGGNDSKIWSHTLIIDNSPSLQYLFMFFWRKDLLIVLIDLSINLNIPPKCLIVIFKCFGCYHYFHV